MGAKFHIGSFLDETVLYKVLIESFKLTSPLSDNANVANAFLESL
jgi:hypothetical protein